MADSTLFFFINDKRPKKWYFFVFLHILGEKNFDAITVQIGFKQIAYIIQFVVIFKSVSKQKWTILAYFSKLARLQFVLIKISKTVMVVVTKKTSKLAF